MRLDGVNIRAQDHDDLIRDGTQQGVLQVFDGCPPGRSCQRLGGTEPLAFPGG